MKTPNVSIPNNIYHYCQRNFIDSNLLNLKFKNSERRMGALPYDWLKAFKSRKYARITKCVDRIFRSFSAKDSLSKLTEDDKSRFVKKLSQILRRDDIQIKFHDFGAFKKCYKLTVGDYSYALLTFQHRTLEFDTLSGHGALVEPCRIFDFYREYSHGRVAKPFMTRFVNDIRAEKYDSYMLMKFIDKNDKTRFKCDLPEYQKDFYEYKISDFNDGNIVNGVCVDIGRIEENPNCIKSGKLRQNLFSLFAKLFHNRKENYTDPEFMGIEINQARKNKKAIHNAEDFICDLIWGCQYDIYNIDIRPFIKDFNPLEQKYIIKKIRALKKAHKLKLKLQQAGEYDICKKYLEDEISSKCTFSLEYELLN